MYAETRNKGVEQMHTENATQSVSELKIGHRQQNTISMMNLKNLCNTRGKASREGVIFIMIGTLLASGKKGLMGNTRVQQKQEKERNTNTRILTGPLYPYSASPVHDLCV